MEALKRLILDAAVPFCQVLEGLEAPVILMQL